MTATEIVAELKTLGSETTKKTLMKHGAKEPFFGVKVEHLKKIQKRIKMDYQLALDLYDTGILRRDVPGRTDRRRRKMTKKDLDRWVKGAYWSHDQRIYRPLGRRR